MRNRIWSAVVGLAVAACSSGGGGGPTGSNNPPAVAGTYNATFTATQATGCQDFVTTGSSTTGALRVTQAGSSVTLHISELRPEFRSNPIGTLSSAGSFQFGPGVVLLDPTPGTPEDVFNAEGTFSGTFSGTSMNVNFDFTAFGVCHVVGTIVGQRT